MTAQLTIANLYPLCMSALGDEGNAKVLRHRAEQRGVSASIVTTYAGPLPRADIYLIGGGWHPEQPRIVELLKGPDSLARRVADGAVVLGINAGFQVLGEWFDTPDGTRHAGLGLLGVRTSFAPLVEGRVVTLPNTALRLPALSGFECHPARTELDPDVEPFARLDVGVGNGYAARVSGHRGGGFAAVARGGFHGSYANANGIMTPITNGPDPSALRRAQAASNANRKAHSAAGRAPSHTNRGVGHSGVGHAAAGHSGARTTGSGPAPGAARIVPTTSGLSSSNFDAGGWGARSSDAPSGRRFDVVGDGRGGSDLVPAAEGAIKDHVIGTYLHGPVLARNRELADLLLSWALGRQIEPLGAADPHAARRSHAAGERAAEERVSARESVTR